jgi:beta-N-acetylhexosaminidase
MIGLPGPRLDPATARRLRALGPGGAILFARNLDAIPETIALADELRALLPPPTLLAIDQEGGRVNRLERWIGPTPAAAAWERAGPEGVRRFARATGRVLAALGFNLDFAPVVDLCAPGTTNGIGDRSFGCDPGRVARLAEAFLAGLADAGLAGCLKHFPGLGATDVDSHHVLPIDRRSRAELEASELAPFRALIHSAPAVMVSHASYPAFEAAPDRPATLSPAIVSGLLRTELGFGGLIVTDDLEMKAVAALDRRGEAASDAIDAGCDLVLYASDLDRAEEAHARLEERAGQDARFAARLGAAAAAVERLAQRFPAAAGAAAVFESSRAELSLACDAARG